MDQHGTFKKMFRSGIGHIHVCSLLIMIPSSNRVSGFATEQKHLAWEFRPGFLSSLLSFSTSIRREHYLIVCKGFSCQNSVSVFRHCPCYRSAFKTLDWKKEDDLWADPSILSMFFFGDGGVRFEPARYFYLNMGVKLVMVKDQSLARRSVC